MLSPLCRVCSQQSGERNGAIATLESSEASGLPKANGLDLTTEGQGLGGARHAGDSQSF